MEKITWNQIEIAVFVGYYAIRFINRKMNDAAFKAGDNYSKNHIVEKDIRLNPYGGTGYVPQQDKTKTNVNVNVHINQ